MSLVKTRTKSFIFLFTLTNFFLLVLGSQARSQTTVFTANFDIDSEGFVYSDDTFRNTGNPAYAGGAFQPTGGFSGGGLRVTLGGVDNNPALGMSGGWTRSFEVSGSSIVTITLRYRLVFAKDYDPDECGQALVAVDGNIISPGPGDFLREYCGTGLTQNSGWQQITVNVGLAAGTHSIVVGGWSNGKTSLNEVMDVYYDDITVTEQPAEILCSDVIDNDGDGFTDCADIDCATASNCIPPNQEAVCNDSVDNDGDGLTDCADADCNGVGGCGPITGLLSASFDVDSNAFVYADDTFRGTNNPVYSTGNFTAGFSGGGLRVGLGGADNTSVIGMSGGWSKNFVLNSAGVVNVTLRYRLVLSRTYEPDECGQALVAIDANLVGQGTSDFLQQFCGTGVAQDSGWQQVTFTSSLNSGTHTIAVGGFNNKKSSIDEVTNVYFDDIQITGQGPVQETNCTDLVDNDLDGQTDCADSDCSTDPVCTETGAECSDLVDNDGDAAIDCADTDCATAANCNPETACSDGQDNDLDGQIDCADTDCSGLAGCTLSTIFSATFNTDSEGFAYSDDTFRNTSNPAFARGTFEPAGGFSGGGLRVTLGGVNNSTVLGMSGGWSRSFVLSGSGVINIILKYRLVFSQNYEPDECGQALVAIDGNLVGQGSNDYLQQYCGTGAQQNSGWRDVTLSVNLTAGTHTITVGGWNNKKDNTNETANVYFDNIMLIQTDTPLIFFDDFNDGNASGWTAVNDSGVSHNWQVINGEYNQLNSVENFTDSFQTGTYSFYNNGSSLTDYQVTAEFTPVADGAGLMFRYQNNNNYYRFSMSRTHGFSRLEKKVNGAFSTIAFDGRGPLLGQSYTIRINVDGPKILVYLNNEPLFSSLDSSLSSGSVALYTTNNTRFDDVVVQQNGLAPQIVISQPTSYSVEATNSLDVSAVARNVPTGGGVKFVLDGSGASAVTDLSEPYTAQFSNIIPPPGDHIVAASIVDSSGNTISGPTTQDTNTVVGVDGNYFVAMGDSITAGNGDDNPADDESVDGRNINRGYPPVLNDLLTGALSNRPITVYAEAIGGTTASDGLNRLNSTIARHAGSQFWLIMFGTNDSGGSMPAPSGLGLQPGDAGYNGSFKARMQGIITALINAGKVPLLAKIPITLGPCSVCAPYTDPSTATRNVRIRDYNMVIDELVGDNFIPVVPPDFYAHFEDNFLNSNADEFFDNFHPDGDGYISMGALWSDTLIQSGILNQ